MDQVKVILNQMIRYRFWIVIGIAAILPVVGYFATAGTLVKETQDKEAEITSAQKDVQQYSSGTIPNAPYKLAVDQKKEEVAKDVDASWRKLYERQAPLLEWPEEVSDRIPKWGRKWPEGVAPRVIANAVEDYLRIYPATVTSVYQVFRPWDPVEGTGIVVAPPEKDLLRPAPFDPNKPPLPSLGKVWAAQERLWIQGTVLKLIDEVNRKAKAKDWESAPIKRINSLEVASPNAMDQRSIAKGEKPEPAPDITDPNKPAEPAPSAAPAGAAGGNDMAAMMAAALPGSEMGGGMMGTGPKVNPEEVYYLASPNPDQVQIVPIYTSIYIDQAFIPDLLIECQNSPMSIQVLEFEMQRPAQRLTKPVKGEQLGFGMMAGMMPGMMPGGERILGASSMMYNSMMMPAGADPGMMMMPGAMGAMPGMYGGPSAPTRKGQRIERNVSPKKKTTDTTKKEEEPASKTADPYFNIVELHLYGQARFYLPPPEPPATEEPTSEAATADAATPETTTGETAPVNDEAKADEAKADEAMPKADEAAPKADADVSATPNPNPDAAATEPQPDAPKDEATPSPSPDETPKTEPGDDPAAKGDAQQP